MNYSDQMLENKAFNFFKQLMYNLAVAVCIVMLGVLVLVYGFKFRLYEVQSDSQAPYYVTGDMVVVKSQKEYKVGDIIKFDNAGTPTTHRLIYVLSEGGETYYICHGDANAVNLDGSERDFKWEDDYAYIKNLVEEKGYNLSQVKSDVGNQVQTPTLSKIEGKVVAYTSNAGAFFGFIKEHWMLCITIVAGIWCVSSVVQNEMEIKRSLRLL